MRKRRPISAGDPNARVTSASSESRPPAFSISATKTTESRAAAAITDAVWMRRVPPAQGASARPPRYAITLGNEFELSEYSRDDLIYTKDMLLAEPIKRIPVQDADLYDTPIPAYKRDS